MAEKNQKDSSPPPLLLMSTSGLTLSPPDQPSVLMPVVQSESSLPDLDDGEADSFVGQGSTVGVPTLGDAPHPQGVGPSGSMTYFQSSSSGANDPFAQVAYIPPPQPLPASFSASSSLPPPQPLPASMSLPHTSIPAQSNPVASSISSGYPTTGPSGPISSGVDLHSKGWTPPVTSDNAGANIYRQKGPMRYAQPHTESHSFRAASSVTHPDLVVPPSLDHPRPPPPSGFSPAPFMTPGPASGPVSQEMTYFPGTSSQSGQQRDMLAAMGVYHAVRYHWCYCKVVEGQEIWCTFSKLDSDKLEQQYLKERNGGAPAIVSTDGGRYDVEIGPRLRSAVYWKEDPFNIQRCSWFYKRDRDNRYMPFDETVADSLEAEYKHATEHNDWHKRIELPRGDSVVMHSSSVFVHFHAASQPDEWGNVQSDQRPRVVKRGVDDFGTVESGESEEVDHLIFVLHGIGETCDVQFRNIVDCVDDFRSISNELIKSHFGPYAESGHVHRVEYLPVQWHGAVHSDTTGVDNRLKAITLPSTQKLRDFVNNTLMDILFYSSPAYCQTICDKVCQEMNRLFQLFLARNPLFSGEVSVAGHSLGASILFDLLLHQEEAIDATESSTFNGSTDTLKNSTESQEQMTKPKQESSEQTVTFKKDAADSEGLEAVAELTLEQVLDKVGLTDKMPVFQQEQIDLDALTMCSEQDLKDLGLPMGPRRKLQLILNDQKGKKERRMRQEIREEIRQEFEDKLRRSSQQNASDHTPDLTRRRMSSISVNYICGMAGTGQPCVNYQQLEFSPTCLFALGSPIGVFLSIRGVEQVGENFKLPTCPRFLNIYHPFDPVAYRMEPLISPPSASLKPVQVPHYKGRKRLHLELRDSLTRMGTDLKQKIVESLRSTWQSMRQFARAHRSDSSRASDSEEGLEIEVDHHVNSVMAQMTLHQDDKSDTASVCSSHDEDIPMGQLNEGRRVDYVLQETPIESFNDYLFALSSHACYWLSEDTVLLILKEVYSPLGISPIMPGPDGRTPKLVMPPAPGHPPSPSQLSSLPTYTSPLLPPAGPSSSSPCLSVGAPLSQGPHFTSPYLLSGKESQGSSRSSTPPFSGQGVPPGGRPTSAGPPPTSGFVRSSQ